MNELKRAKEHTIGRFRLSLETAFSLGQRHGEHLLMRGEIEEIESYVEDTEKVTPDEMISVRLAQNMAIYGLKVTDVTCVLVELDYQTRYR